jgi:hypothetical protein
MLAKTILSVVMYISDMGEDRRQDYHLPLDRSRIRMDEGMLTIGYHIFFKGIPDCPLATRE